LVKRNRLWFNSFKFWLLKIVNTQLFNGSIDDVRVYNRGSLGGGGEKPLQTRDAYARKYRKPGKNASLQKGLVGYWSFNSPDMAENISYDRSGQGNNGTLTSGPSIIEGKLGQALSFDGNDDVIQVTRNTGLEPATITVAGWIKASSFSGTSVNEIIGKQANGTAGTGLGEGNSSYNPYTNSSGIAKFTLYDGSSETTIRSPTLSVNTWYHVAGTLTGGNMILYLGTARAVSVIAPCALQSP
jgi:Concanavalin A-like lectin/glucanases superfamily